MEWIEKMVKECEDNLEVFSKRELIILFKRLLKEAYWKGRKEKFED